MKWPWENENLEKQNQVVVEEQMAGQYDDQYVLLQKINKVYGKKFHAVHDFSLCVRKKEFVVFVGPSGCGKSTTLRMIAGLEDISSGNLFIDGEYANNLLSKDRDIAMVFQNYALYPNMTIYNNMAFGLKVRKNVFPVYEMKDNEAFAAEVQALKEQFLEEKKKEIARLKSIKAHKDEKKDFIFIHNLCKTLNIMELKKKYLNPVFTYDKEKVKEIKALIKAETDPAKINELNSQLQIEMATLTTPKYCYRHYHRDEIAEKVCNAAHILEIVDQLRKRPKELSGGQRQRVALGRTIVRNAKIFLMDEPLSNLDAKLRVQMRSEITELHKKINATTIYVTHDQTEAMTMADRIVVMKDGYIQQIGTPMEIYQHPRNLFVASFIGSPAMNIIAGVYDKGVITFANGQSVKLNKEIIKRHDDYYAKQYADENRKYPEFIEQLNEEKTAFEAKNYPAKEREEFEEKYNKLLNEKDELICKLDKIIHGEPHDIIFGIRPEAIVEEACKGSIKIKVRLSELLGDQYFIHFDFGGKDILSKVSAEKLIESGTEMNLKMVEEKIHIFDKDTEMAIL